MTRVLPLALCLASCASHAPPQSIASATLAVAGATASLTGQYVSDPAGCTLTVCLGAVCTSAATAVYADDDTPFDVDILESCPTADELPISSTAVLGLRVASLVSRQASTLLSATSPSCTTAWAAWTTQLAGSLTYELVSQSDPQTGDSFERLLFSGAVPPMPWDCDDAS